MAKSLSWQVIKQKAADLCASRERTVKEVYEKLVRYGLSQEESDQMVEELLNDGFINEARYAKAFCHDKFIFNKWGRVKIRYELLKKGLSTTDIEAGLLVIGENDYRETALQLLHNKAAALKEKTPYKIKSKIVTYMIGKGYEPAFVMELYDDIREG